MNRSTKAKKQKRQISWSKRESICVKKYSTKTMLRPEKMCHAATYYQILHGQKVIDEGISRPNAANTFFTSVHAEIKAAMFLREYGHMRKVRVFIWRIANGAKVPAYCCLTCTKFLQKRGIADRFFTLHGTTVVPAVVDHPKLSKGTLLKLTTKNYIPISK